jgi:putative RecB family exonuclease
MYRLKTIDQLPTAPSAAAVRGTLVHEVLERLFNVAPAERTMVEAQRLAVLSWHELCDIDPKSAETLIPEGLDSVDAELHATHALDPIRPLLETYFAMEDPARLEPHAREMALSVALEQGFEIRGFVDRVDRSPEGLIRIVDYKTGKSPSPAFEAKAMFQMRFYALAWWRLTDEVPAQLQLMYLGNREFVRYAPTTDDLLATERKILAIRDAIGRAGDQEDFKATPSRLCSWCDFKQFCPEFGGVVPPLPPKSEWLSGSSRVTVALHSAISTAQKTKTPVQEGSI